MSLYDEAAVALIAEGAAGKDGVLYNIKPEEKLKPTELLENGSFAGSTGWFIPAGDASFVSVSDGKAVFTNAVADEYRRIRTEDDAEGRVFKAGRKYKISFTVTDFERSADDVDLRAAEVDNKLILLVSGNGNFSTIYTAQADERFQFKVAGGAGVTSTLSCKISNVSIKEVEQAPLDFTFTRNSNLTATRVAPSGYIEKGRENLFTFSNDPTNDDWVKTGITVTSGQSGYDGSSNAFKLTKTADSYRQISQTISDTGVKTISVYAKKGSLDVVTLFHRADGSADTSKSFNLTSGSLGATNASSNFISASIEDIGNGWYRCSMAYNHVSGDVVRIYPGWSDTVAGDIFIQNAQLEAGLVATDYIDSKGTTGKAGILEDSPRFDYTGGGCPHLLMEPTRKNLVTYSEYAGGFTDVGTGTVTDNHSTSPEGVKNAFQLSESDTGFYRIEENITVSAENVGDHTLSVFVKKTTGSLSHYAGVQLDSARKYVIVDTTNGTANEHNGTANDSFSVEDFSDDYWRVIITNDLASAADYRIGLWPAISSDGTTISATATGSNVFYGVQLEKGAYATSYIPNHGTSAGVTRNDDVTNTVDFGDYMDGEDITWYVELDKNDQLIRDGSTTGIRLSTTDLNASSVKFYRSYAGAPDGIRTIIYFADGENDNDPASHQITEAGPVKVIVRRVKSTGEFTIFYDGAQKYQAFAPANYGKLKTLKIDGEKQPLFINNMFLFDRALTDDECIALTT